MSIRTKLILVLSAVLILAFASTSVITYVVSKDRYRTTTLDEILPLLTSNILSEIQRDLMMPIDIASLMANDTFLKNWVLAGEKDPSQIEEYLKEIKEKYGFFTAFFVSEETAHYYYYDGILKTVSRDDPHDVWYYAFREKDVDVDLDVDTDEASGGSLTIFINYRLVDHEGRFLGVTGVGLNMDSMSQRLSEHRAQYGRMVYMVDSTGLIQAHPDLSLVETASIHDMEGISSVASDILEQDSGPKTYEFDRAGRHVFLIALCFHDFDWYLIVEQEERAAIEHIRSVMSSNLAVGLLTTSIVIGIVILVVNRFQRRLEVLANVDELTNVANRRQFMDTLKTEVNRADRYERGLSLLMIDADHFKSVNDKYGHLAGDKTLMMLAKTIQGCLRETDVLGRLGGEEFAAILPETDLDEALIVAERIRVGVESSSLQATPEPRRITVSVGVALMHAGLADTEDLLHRADSAMYRAKAEGRNRVTADNQDHEDP